MGLDAYLRVCTPNEATFHDNGIVTIQLRDVICESGNYYIFSNIPTLIEWRENRALQKAIYELYCRTVPECIIPPSSFNVCFHLTEDDIIELLNIPNLIEDWEYERFRDAIELIHRGFVVYYISDF